MSRFVYRPRTAAVLAGLMLAGGFALSAAEEASAAPTQCVIKSYFKEAAHTNQVGRRSNCPGVEPWGRTTPYVESEVVQLDQPGPGPAPASGGMPCEFKPRACSPFGR